MKIRAIARAQHFRDLMYKNQGISQRTAAHIYKMLCRAINEYDYLLFYNLDDLDKDIIKDEVDIKSIKKTSGPSKSKLQLLDKYTHATESLPIQHFLKQASPPALSTTSNTPQTQTSEPAPDYKYTVREIPANLATQKAFYNFLIKSSQVKSSQVRVAANSTSINYAPINRKTAGPLSAPKKPTFSVVIRDVPQDISAGDIATLCPSLSIVKACRIISSGSVALLVAQNLASTPHTLPNHFNHLEAVAYRPQDKISADLLRYVAQHNFAIVLGDFNARHTDFGDTLTIPNGRSLNSLLTTVPLCRLHNTDPSFLSHSGCSITYHILSTENFVPFLSVINTSLEKANCFAETLEQIHQVPNDPHFDDKKRQQLPSQPPQPSPPPPPGRRLSRRRGSSGLGGSAHQAVEKQKGPGARRRKVFEKILSTRLKNFLEINNLLPPEQFGFRSERSTINPILEFHTDTTRHANLKEHTLAVFLDIERDFDRVWHDGLVQKLIKIPINPNKPQFHPTHRLLSLKSYLQRQNSEHQGPAQSLFKQGDFPVTDAPRTKTSLFADDTAEWTSQRNPVIAARILQGHLNDITTWTNTWRIKPNPLKSQSILMSYSGANKSSALTPGHYLIGETLMSPPQHDVTDVPTTRLSRYQVLEKLRQHFWTRWSKEYLHQLQQREKWHKTRQPPPLGHLVLLREDNLPPQHSIMGRISEYHPGADGITRAVSVKTVRGVVKRALVKISPGKSELKEGPPSPSFAASPLRRPYPRKVLGVLPPLDPS
ncbi:hypothetical protein GEV33_000014 [Tenebrio molitor]|uniref:Uncharacterized protein n=1 Tax=Tenebrio molitor TaxID=7067 RepID=A0A8J6HYY1_TENMO|nr:hypothetical protein GEV33_000014 [Tenebrio molitor]